MILHIVEPTLNSYAGHCHSLVQAIVEAAPVQRIQIWAGRGGEAYWHGKGELKSYFFRPLRRIQAFFLYHRLLRQAGKILVPTAGTSDLMTLDWVARELIPAHKIYLYIHWIGAKALKATKLADIAKRQPNLEILCTTPSGTTFFGALGFRARTVAYPHSASLLHDRQASEFSHLLVAGAARPDKGFERVVELVETLARSNAVWPILVQTSTTHRDKYSPEIRRLIDCLKGAGYAHLTLQTQTLTPADYLAQFRGGISIQPYSESDFEDRVSGVALDALCAACPIAATANTWLARMVCRYRAGVVTSDLSPAGLITAIEQILSDYNGYAQGAANAARALNSQHSGRVMMAAIFEDSGLLDPENRSGKPEPANF